MKKITNTIINLVIFAMLAVGTGLILYPTLSDSRNTNQQLNRIEDYDSAIQELDNSESERYFEAAQKYNRDLLRSPANANSGYDRLLNVDGSGIMGYVTIPSINVKLPVYHSTNADVLDIGAGHYQGSSLPIGGTDTHAVISAHTGLPSARLFTDVEKMKIGDTFTISVLDRELTYEVEQIFIIEPHQTEYLSIIPGGDYVTLMTCTPYGINTHRLLVRSKRIEIPEEESELRIYADAVNIDSLISYTVITIPFLVILLVLWLFAGRKNSVSKAKNEKNTNERKAE